MGQTLFLVVAAISIASALGVIFNRNVVHSALALLVNFGTLSVLYFMLNAQFLAVAQILVYAGAIVVLFLFVVMLLGAELGEQVSTWVTGKNIFVGFLSFVLLTFIGTTIFENGDIYQTAGKTGNFTQATVQRFGQTEAISRVLFTDYILPFELASILLLVGIVGVVWLARRPKTADNMQGGNND